MVLSNENKSFYGRIITGVVTASALGLSIATSSFILPAFRKICLPFVPATSTQVNNVIKALNNPKQLGMNVVDIGSGDGRIVFKAAKHGFHAFGFELNVWLVLYSKFQAWNTGLSNRAKFYRTDLWKANYSTFDNVIIFGVEEMMLQLEKKLLTEMKSGSKIIACRFPLPTLTPSYVYGQGVDTVWSYHV